MARNLFLWAIIFETWIIRMGNAQRAVKETDDRLQYRPGDILIAGIMPVHGRGNEACSIIQEIGILAVETMNMIIDQVNADNSILPKIKLGSVMIDTCDSDTQAVRKLVLDILPLMLNGRRQSSSLREPKIPPSLVAGVVGGASSAVSIQVANVLQGLKIPQVSYWSTSPDLSNKKRYRYFFRVVPSDTNQASAILAFVKQRGWTYISIVYEDDSYGLHGFHEIRDLVPQHGICISTFQPVPRSPTNEDFRNIVMNLLDKKSKAVIVFTKNIDATRLMIAAQEIGDQAKDLVWVGTDGWTSEIPLANSELDDKTLHGAVGFQPTAMPLKNFEEYFRNLTLEQNLNNYRNPWFPDYIAQNKFCSLGKVNGTGNRKCHRNESVSRFHNLAIMEHVANSVLTMVHALDQHHKRACKGAPGICWKMRRFSGTNGLASRLLPYLKRMKFTNTNGRIVQFDAKHDGPAVYDILTYRADKKVRSGSPLGKWEKVGKYEDNVIQWQKRLVQKVYDVESVCSKPCGLGKATIIETEVCCWHCEQCADYEFVSDNGTVCSKCPPGQKPNKNKTGCDYLPITEMSYESQYGIACVCVSSVGLLLTVIVTAIYIAYRNTAIVKASGNELCFFILFGITITFLNFIPMAARPTYISCIISRLILGLGPACIYAGLVTKTIRVVVIFRARTHLSPKMRKYLRPLYQLLSSLGLVLVQVLLVLAWFILSPPQVSVHYPTSEIAFRACSHLVDLQVLIALLYPFLLIIACTVLATINRHIPTGFNETKYIGFSMYTTCVIWFAYLPMFITSRTDFGQRNMITSICLSLSATVVLVCLFGPKCFKILFRPTLNNQRSIMSPSASKSRSARYSRSATEVS